MILIFLSAFISGCLAIRPSFHIITGLDTTILDHPWMLSINNRSGFHGCGGSLIRVYPNLTRSDIALTAAHCFRSYLLWGRPLNAWVLAGASVNNFNSTTGEKRRVVDVRSYGFFPGDDAALIKLETPLEFTERIKPVDLPAQGYNVPRTATCTVAGWGLQRNSQLQELPVTIQACNDRSFEYGSNFCAGGSTGSICSGDSGSPLVCRADNGDQVQQGIVSYSDPTCGDFPATYSRVSFYTDWIVATAQKMSPLAAPSKHLRFAGL